MNHAIVTPTTYTKSVATSACQVKMVSLSGISPLARPPAVMTSCTGAGLLLALATCNAAEPDNPCAHTVPRPRNAIAPSAR
jgi:hypothetical protein